MIDFLMVSHRSTKNGVEIFPRFIIKKSSDLMIRGGDFYAVWLEDRGLWSTDEQDAIHLIDQELDIAAKKYKEKNGVDVKVLYLWDASTGMIDTWHKYCQKQMRDNFHMLDEKLIFSNTETNKKDYASKRLNYPLESGPTPSYEKLISTLYSEEERHKIEWAIGSIVSGDSKYIQKFMVLYGSAGTGKSTILNIIMRLFDGYCAVFDAKALGSANSSFALEPFKHNPLVAIQHDGDLSRIEDNTRLNSLVSHEEMTVNEKFKSAYTNSFKCFLFMGTNKPVKITDAKSGLIRRLIDVSPSGNKVNPREYDVIMKQIPFELGAIANHCLEVYQADPGYYDDYTPIRMMGASNDFYNFVIDSYHVFIREDGTTLKSAWEMYKVYCDDAKVPYPLSRRNFAEELKNYFRDYNERFNTDDGQRVRSYYSGFRTEKFEDQEEKKPEKCNIKTIIFDDIESIFEKEYADCPAQYATAKEIPSKKWEKVKTKLSDLDTTKIHYVKVPENHIVIDFDIPDKNGNKCFELNLAEASKWPPTYSELSKSGQGIHLHYIYTGDVNKLSRIYDDHIEVKVYTGLSSLRRKLTKCNNLPIASISSGLPLKGEDKMVNFEAIKSERALRTLIKRNLNKEYHDSTASSISFIDKILNDAYESGMGYDVSDMRNAVYTFATQSTNQAANCIKLVNKMKFKSEEPTTDIRSEEDAIVFYDVEVFPNLFLVNWKFAGEGKPVVRMINPKPHEIEMLIRYKLIGFNCRRYDNHMIYACMMGYTNEQLYNLSQKLVNKDKQISMKAMFGEAYNLSYTDVYDFASAGNKKSLKKLEIEMGIHHQELGLPWDKPVPEEKWIEVAEYCDNDVIATEAAFHYLSADWTARQILADLADGSVNQTTNNLTRDIIFCKNRKPQSQFKYRNMAEPVKHLDADIRGFLTSENIIKIPFDDKSLLPYFPGYKYENGKSTYRGEDVGEGGFVYAEPGMHGNVALLDVVSMHPHSLISEVLFGVEFTRRFKEIVDGRVSIKHEAWDEVDKMLDGKLKPYIQKVLNGEMTSKQLANALKTAINAVYGQTTASYENAFKDNRNIDNIVAKRGALFMIDLKYAVQERGFTVAHIKTDSIKIPDATPEIIEFVMEFGKRYGYEFEHEATYDRMCLVNDAVYIAKYASVESCSKLYDYIPGDNAKDGGKWTATGAQFAVPYVYKKLFVKEPIEFEDLCTTQSTQTALYLDMNENLRDVSMWEDLKNIRETAEDKRTKKAQRFMDENNDISDEELNALIAEGHDYRFIGKVGSFCPIKPGCNGGILYREQAGKFNAATGTSGYRWLESEAVTILEKQDDIDRSYFDALANDAVDTINKYGDFEWFISDDPYIPAIIDYPPWEEPVELPF